MKKKIFGILVLALVVLNVNASHIDEKNDKDKKVSTEKNIKTENDANIKYIGEAKGNGIVFDVDFKNPTGESFSLIVSDNQGSELFSQVFSGTNFHKSIMIKKDGDADGNVEFSLRNKGKNIYSKTFSMNVETRVLRNVVVKSVN